MRLIDADRLLDLLKDNQAQHNNELKGSYYDGVRSGLEVAIVCVEHAPVIEERKHGYWERTDRYWWECSVCGGKNWIGRLREADSCKTPHCPHCGAVMDEAK